MKKKMKMPEEEWRKKLTPQAYHVLREKGTELAYSGKYSDIHGKGTYVCAACGNKLFSSGTKYDSQTGWPSFYAPMEGEAVEEEEDTSHGMRRTEVHCAVCGGHLGHIFNDGPEPTGKRYCVNSVALDFKKEE